MIQILRKHRNWLMIVIAILALPFCIYFVRSDIGAIRPDEFVRMYGRTITLIEARRDARLFDLALALGMSQFLQDLSGRTDRDPQGQVYGQFIINLQILRHEAEGLGVHPAPSEIVERVRNLEAFRGPAGFDMNKYSEFVQNVLSPNGQTEAQIEDVVRDALALERIKQLVTTGIGVSESEAKTDFEKLYAKLSVTLIRLSAADFAKDVKVTDEEVWKYYEQHKAELKSSEKRKVDFVKLTFTPEQTKLTGKERVDALQKLADRANDVSQALLEKGADFQQVAAKFQLPVQTTPEFTHADPDPEFRKDPQLSTAAFKLTAQDPISDPIQVGDGFYILHLAGIVEARPLTLEEAKPQIAETIRSQHTRESLLAKGDEIVKQLREAAAANQPLAAAIEKTGAKSVKLPPFSIVDEAIEKLQEQKPDANELLMVKNAVADLEPGGVSDLFPLGNGAAIAIVEKRDPPDPVKYAEQKTAFEQRFLTNMRLVAFREWLRDRAHDAGLQTTRAQG
jgi:parvulin-like peptidyl-prolyl isomerase